MRSSLVGRNDQPKIELHEVSSDDIVMIDGYIDRFAEATPHNNETFCELLRSDVRASLLHTETLERLSVWCHTGQPPNGVCDAAAELARRLMGVVPPRLRERCERRVEDYDLQVADLGKLMDGSHQASVSNRSV